MLRRLLALSLCLASLPVLALDFRSVGAPSAILYDSPSTHGKPLVVVNRNFPLELVLSKGHWGRVRDPSGKMYWIELDRLTTAHILLVRKESDARADASNSAPVIAHVRGGVLLPWQGTLENGRAAVKLPDGRTAWLGLDALWGL